MQTHSRTIVLALTAAAFAAGSIRAFPAALAPVPAPTQARPAAAAAARPAPEVVIASWEKLIGTWVADNSTFKNEDEKMDAYGIEWRWGLGKRSLVGRLYGLESGKEVGTFWEFREFWHPGEGRLIMTQHAGDGTYGEGPHDVKADGTSEMVQTFFDPGTGTRTTVGHRAKLEGNVHTTSSFNVDEKGVWTPRRTYIWRRQ
jgi:hypothetical protein